MNPGHAAPGGPGASGPPPFDRRRRQGTSRTGPSFSPLVVIEAVNCPVRRLMSQLVIRGVRAASLLSGAGPTATSAVSRCRGVTCRPPDGHPGDMRAQSTLGGGRGIDHGTGAGAVILHPATASGTAATPPTGEHQQTRRIGMTRTGGTGSAAVAAARSAVLPLALAQFVASYAGSNMNVAISAIATDLDTTVTGIQTTITLFTLTMAALMIPGSKLTDIWGRKFCFLLGLIVYGAGALLATFAQGLPILMIGYSLLEGVGSALLIPPIYILITVLFDDKTTRAKYFGVVSGAAGIGSAAGPLVGGLITSYVSWRASFLLQVLIVAAIAWMGRSIAEPPLPAQRPSFDGIGAVLSALGLFFVVFGVLQSGVYGWGRANQDYALGSTVII